MMISKRQGTIVGFVLLLAVSLWAEQRSAWVGVFTEEQATRGETGYLNQCARCHGETLMGGEESPALVDEDFLAKWYGHSAGDLVERIRKTMPTDGPGTLSRRLCTDIAAYLLRANGFPAGKTEMESDLETLNQIRIEPKP